MSLDFFQADSKTTRAESVPSLESTAALLGHRAVTHARKTAFIFLGNDNTEKASFTYGELDAQACAIGAWLQKERITGKPVLMLFPDGEEFIKTFFGCLYAAAPAVPIYLPRPSRSQERFEAIVSDVKPALVLTTSSVASQIRPLLTQIIEKQCIPWRTLEEISSEGTGHYRPLEIKKNDLAFIQYTSGSTSSPKGVMVTHGNLLHNEETIKQAFRQDDRSVIVGWLPLFHDMGLIGNVLQPLFAGAKCILLSPVSFLQRPINWLEAITKYRATTSGGPNFAYDLCIRKTFPEERKALDLSSWNVAFNGAEPVRKDTLDRFDKTFSPFGFHREAFSPCYGLAESTLFVSGGAPESYGPTVKFFHKESLEWHRVIEISTEDETSRSLVSCGKPWLGQEIRIVDPEMLTECPARQVGEIWIGGPSIAEGYWRNPEETQRTFQAHLRDTDEGPFLRSGDLGFIEEQELFITGRLKDLIIIRGRNHYPQDIELTVRSSGDSLRTAEGAAFSIDVDNEEQLVIVQEVSRSRRHDLAEIAGAIRKAISEEHALQVYAISLIKPGTMLKTSSGKIRRHAVKKAFLHGDLKAVFQWRLGDASQTIEDSAASSEDCTTARQVEQRIIAQLANKLGLASAEINVNQPLAFYGLDSLANIELVRWVEVTFNISLASSFLQDTSVARIAELVLDKRANSLQIPDRPLNEDERPREFPLTFGQRALWFLHYLAPKSTAYNLAGAVRISGIADVEVLKKAFQAILDRHRILRARFELRAGSPIHIIQKNVAAAFYETEVAASFEEITKQMQQEAHSTFDLEKGPLFRVYVWKCTNGEHVLLMVAHHIIMDLHSAAVLLRDLGIFYEAGISGKQSTPAPLEAAYEDYVYWQQQILAGERGEQLWNYWRNQLSDELPLLELATDHPRPQIQSYKGAIHTVRLSLEESRALKNLACQSCTTLFVVLLAIYKILLFRYTKQEDLLVGCPTSGRILARFDPLIGYFTNPIAIRSKPSTHLSFRNFLAQMKQTVLAGIEHQEYPFALLVERLNLQRDPSYSPIFQTMFILQKIPSFVHDSLAEAAIGNGGARLQLGPLTLETIHLDLQYSQFDLTLSAADSKDGLALSLQYNTDLFDPLSMLRLLGHFTMLSKGAVDRQELSICDMPLLTEAECQQCLREFNETGRDYSSGLCVHQLFEKQAEDTPHAIAAIFNDEHLSYDELNARATRLASYLRTAGVTAETPVAVLMERQIRLVIALMGVLKAGGTYVGLDIAYPKERLLLILNDAGVNILLTESHLKGLLPEYKGAVICFDELDRTGSPDSFDLPEVWVSDQNLAYLIYTSGSTGRPKAVAIEHRSAVTLIQWARETYTSNILQGVLFSTSICFDLSIFELFVPLSCGGTTVIARDGFALLDKIHGDAITLINTVPSVLRELLLQDGIPESVNTINVAGEPLTQDLVEKAYSLPNIQKVFNLYGPSEDTTYSTISLAERDRNKPDIGMPIANTQVYIADEHSILPINVPGELLIGGDGVARGYLYRPDLTAEKFVPDSYGLRAGSRLYKTGDLARRRQNGSIEFLGRMDRQAKIRGFRIELGEIEAMLRQHPSIEQAVVTVKEDEAGKHLVAYVVTGDALTPEVLRDYLRERLPGYMIPATFITPDEIPTTPSGKINYKALPAPQRAASLEKYVAPRTSVELLLTGIWQEVLRTERLGMNDNFFNMGGDSIKSIQVVTRAKQAGLHISPEQIFTFQTIAELATVALASSTDQVSANRAASLNTHSFSGADAVFDDVRGIVESENIEDVVPVTSLQEGMLFECLISSGSCMYVNQQSYTLQGNIDVFPLKKAFQTVLNRHQGLRSAFLLTRQGKPFQAVYSHLELPWQYYDWSDLPSARQNSSVEELLQSDRAQAFDLDRPPLFRVRLVRLRADLHEFTLTFHLLLLDGWSISLIFQELLTLYYGYCTGRHVELSPPSPIRNYKQWLAEHKQPEAEFYWRQLLEGFSVPNGLTLMQQHSNKLEGQVRRAEEVLICDQSSTVRLDSFARQNHLTLNTLLQGIWGLYLAQNCGVADVVFGTVVSGRSAQVAGMETMVGMFLNTLPVRIRIDDKQELLPWLRAVQAQLAQARCYETTSLSDIQRWSNIAPGKQLFETIVIFQNFPLEISTSRPGEDLSVVAVKWAEVNSYPLTLIGTPGNELALKIVYACDGINERSARKILDRIYVLLNRMVSNPQVTLGQLVAINELEQAQLIEDFTQNLELR